MAISNDTRLDLLSKVILKRIKKSLSRKNDSLRIIMALVAYYDLEIHQIDVKTTFLKMKIEKKCHGSTRKFYS